MTNMEINSACCLLKERNLIPDVFGFTFLDNQDKNYKFLIYFLDFFRFRIGLVRFWFGDRHLTHNLVFDNCWCSSIGI